MSLRIRPKPAGSQCLCQTNTNCSLTSSNFNHNFPNFQLSLLQQIQNSLVDVFLLISQSIYSRSLSPLVAIPILKSLHWLKVNEHIKYKLFSLTYNILNYHST